PSAGGAFVVANGCALWTKTVSAVKKVPKESSTAVAYGAISRSLRRVRNRITLDHTDSSKIHNSSDPAWVDQMAAALYSVGVVVLEALATTLYEKSLRRKATSRIA